MNQETNTSAVPSVDSLSPGSRYRLLAITTHGEHVIGKFEWMPQACDEMYRRQKAGKNRAAGVVLEDTWMNERWGYYEMLATGLSKLCTEAEHEQAKRFCEAG